MNVNDVQFKMAEQSHAESIHAIYVPYVENTFVSFEYETPSVAEIWRRMSQILKSDPWIIAMHDRAVVGYAYASTFRKRSAYSWVREVSVYVSDHAKGKGVAKTLYDRLFALLKAQGYRRVLAGVSQPNPASNRFHEKMGFDFVGRFEDIGYKFGQLSSVEFWAMTLEDEVKPDLPLSIHELAPEIVEDILGA